MTNAINPSHYKSDTIECIDAMKACSTHEEFRGHLKLTVMKYLWREDKKGEGDQARVENLEKAAWYLERLILDLRVSEEIESSITVNDAISAATTAKRNLYNQSDADAIPPHTINAADQGWIEWSGGEQPAETKGKRVDTFMGQDKYHQINGADSLRWSWEFGGQGGDIRRYRVVK